MADKDHLIALFAVALALLMYFRDQRTGGVDHMQIALLGVVLDAPGHAVGAKNGYGTDRHFVDFLDEDRAFGPQGLHDTFVVDDLVPDIDRRTEFFEGAFDYIDGPFDPRRRSRADLPK